MWLWYGVEEGYLRIELDDGSVLLVAASWEGCHVVVDPAVPATRKGRPHEGTAPKNLGGPQTVLGEGNPPRV